MATPNQTNELEVVAEAAPPVRHHDERSIEEVVAQMVKVQQLMKSALIKDEHYGVIPGTNKPSLLQPGAQKLCFMFRIVPSFHVDRVDLPGDHREYSVRCRLENSLTSIKVGEGVGLCSTMESKYRWRKAERACPGCGAECIKRSKFAEEGGEKGWYCYGKIGGCGEQFSASDDRIVGQETGRKENPDIADTYNTVLKMAKKRAFVDATLTATAASDIFTQDVEDMDTGQPKAEPQKPAPDQATAERPKTISKPQQNDLWKHAMARAEDTGSTREQIMRDALVVLELEATSEISAADFDRVVGMVESWEPEMDFGKEEPGADG